MPEPDTNIPYYMTKEFLEKLLVDNIDHKQGKLSIIKYTNDNPVSRGNNYTSNIVRIDIEYKITTNNELESTRNIALLVKVPLAEGDLALMQKANIFEKEFKAYKELMPKLTNIMRKETEHIYDLIPKRFKIDTDAILILENLTTLGYKLASRSEQLDYEHCVLTLKSIGKFHAAAVKLHEDEPELVEKYGTDLIFKKPLDEEVKAIIDPILGEQHLEMICNEFKKWPETRKYVDFITKLKPKMWDIYLELLHAKDGEFTCLIHGDLWTSNLLYKYDDNSKPVTLMFLDFQVMRYSNPAVDVLNFLYTSVRYEVLKTYFCEVTDIYLDTLNLYLEKYGSSKRLSKEEFRKSLEIREMFCLIQSINCLCYCFAEYNEPCDSEEGSQVNSPPIEIPFARLLQNKKYISTCATYLEDFSKTPWYKSFQ